MMFLTTIGVFFATIYTVNGLCNTCSATTGIACVGDSKFQICVDGTPTPPSVFCPTGTICTPNGQVCAPDDGAVQSSCARCRACVGNNIFACIGYNEFALCVQGAVPDGSPEYTCDADLVCSIDANTICVNATATGVGATCSLPEPVIPEPEDTTTMVPTTTPNPETHPREFCALKQLPGRYDLITDTSCRKYISCLQANDKWEGNLYECSKMTFFNPATEMCGNEKPVRCALS